MKLWLTTDSASAVAPCAVHSSGELKSSGAKSLVRTISAMAAAKERCGAICPRPDIEYHLPPR